MVDNGPHIPQSLIESCRLSATPGQGAEVRQNVMNSDIALVNIHVHDLLCIVLPHNIEPGYS